MNNKIYKIIYLNMMVDQVDNYVILSL